MSVQARLKEDSPLYNANRDVAHCFPAVVKEVANRLEDQRWTPVTAYLQQEGVSMDDLGQACEAFVLFVHGTVDNPKEKMGELLFRSGWFDVKEPAQVAYMAYLGTVLAGVFFHGAREATLGGDGPCSKVQDLIETGRRCHKLMVAPKLGRPFLRLYWRIEAAIKILFGR